MNQELPEAVVKITSAHPGPTVAIISGTHGDELAGQRAVASLQKRLQQIQKGTLYLITGNPRAVTKKVRQTEQNLNRCFIDNAATRSWRKTYEYQRARELKKILDRCDAVLDLHATSIPDSQPFIIAEPKEEPLTRYFPIKTVCSNFNKVEPGGIDYYLNQKGKIGIAIECGYLDAPSSTKIGQKCIQVFLEKMSLWPAKTKTRPTKQKKMQVYKLYCNQHDTFKLSKPFNNFEYIPKKTIIGHDGPGQVVSEQDSYIIFAHDRNKKGEECFLLARPINYN